MHHGQWISVEKTGQQSVSVPQWCSQWMCSQSCQEGQWTRALGATSGTPIQKKEKTGKKVFEAFTKACTTSRGARKWSKKGQNWQERSAQGAELQGCLTHHQQKMEILKRYQELAETTKHPEKAWFGLRFVEYLLPDKNGFFLHRTTCRHCLDEYSMYMHRQPNGKPDTFVSLALVGEAYTRRIDMIYSMCWFANPLYHLCGERSPSQNARIWANPEHEDIPGYEIFYVWVPLKEAP